MMKINIDYRTKMHLYTPLITIPVFVAATAAIFLTWSISYWCNPFSEFIKNSCTNTNALRWWVSILAGGLSLISGIVYNAAIHNKYNFTFWKTE